MVERKPSAAQACTGRFRLATKTVATNVTAGRIVVERHFSGKFSLMRTSKKPLKYWNGPRVEAKGWMVRSE